MFSTCRAYLIDRLKTAGIKTQPFTAMKQLKTSSEKHLGAVLTDGETFSRSGSKTIYRDIAGDKHKRRKVFDRKLTFSVIIGEYDQDKCEEIFVTFLASLDTGIYVDGNYVSIEVEDADWVEEEDSILKAKVAVQMKVHFSGGIYRDTDSAKVKQTEITLGKESGNG